MGKGDKKTKRGKIVIGSHGVRRPKKKKNAYVASTKHSKAKAKVEVVPKTEPQKPAPEKAASVLKEESVKKEVKKTAVKKTTAKKAAKEPETKKAKKIEAD